MELEYVQLLMEIASYRGESLECPLFSGVLTQSTMGHCILKRLQSEFGDTGTPVYITHITPALASYIHTYIHTIRI